MSKLQEIAQQIIDDHKNGDVDVVDLIYSKVLISDLSELREILMPHKSSNETNSADLAIQFIDTKIEPKTSLSM